MPHIPLDHLWPVAALGLLGTTISPYMLFWQANEDVEGANGVDSVDDDAAHRGVVIGMVFSNIVAFFIVVCAAATTYATGGQINSIADAARVLSPLGWFGDEIFVATFIGAGLLALPTLAGSSAFAVAELFGWPEGLDREVPTRAVSMWFSGRLSPAAPPFRSGPTFILQRRCSIAKY